LTQARLPKLQVLVARIFAFEEAFRPKPQGFSPTSATRP
jgi:hypothetical protein